MHLLSYKWREQEKIKKPEKDSKLKMELKSQYYRPVQLHKDLNKLRLRVISKSSFICKHRLPNQKLLNKYKRQKIRKDFTLSSKLDNKGIGS